tara:strand:+ start:1808 stop:2647 length:840 start_codon:yes stop_codon:yes gene_type:complete
MIIWIASYPKCGNTWVRSLLSAYYFTKDGEFNFNLLKNIKQFPSKDFFEKRVTSVEEASAMWIPIQKKIKETRKLYFLKTHNVYGAYKGNNFTTPEYTLGAINIVRDPRNVITSLMNHYSIDEEEALKMLSSVHRNLRDKNDKDDYSNYSFISSWSNNYNSWKISKNINKILIKYEDLEKNRLETFSKILNFVNKLINKNNEIDTNKLIKSISSTNFDVLKSREKVEGFDEAAYSNDRGERKPFFNLGNKNNYKKLLKNETVKSIEKKFEKEMIELGYL